MCPGIWRGKLRAQVGALVYEKNFLFLKRATMRVGPLRRDGMGQVLAQPEKGWARVRYLSPRPLYPRLWAWPWRRWDPRSRKRGMDGALVMEKEASSVLLSRFLGVPC